MNTARLRCPSVNGCGRCGGPETWRASSALAAGATFFGIGIATGATGLAVFGVLVVIAALAYRIRAHYNFWFTCTLRPEDSTIVVEPTHRRFDEAARALFIRTLR